eukprot:851518-Amphidinium_carterae.1
MLLVGRVDQFHPRASLELVCLVILVANQIVRNAADARLSKDSSVILCAASVERLRHCSVRLRARNVAGVVNEPTRARTQIDQWQSHADLGLTMSREATLGPSRHAPCKNEAELARVAPRSPIGLQEGLPEQGSLGSNREETHGQSSTDMIVTSHQ